MAAQTVDTRETFTFRTEPCAHLGAVFDAVIAPADRAISPIAGLSFTPPFAAPVLAFAQHAQTENRPEKNGTKSHGETHLFPAPTDGKILVHEYQVIRRLRPIPMEQPLNLSMQVAPETEPGNPFGFSTEIHTPDQTLVATTQTRLRILDIENFRRMRGTGLPRSIDPDTHQRLGSAQITPQIVAQYVALSGDNNPLHVDDRYAQAYGLSGAIVPGMLVVGTLENVIARLHPAHHTEEMRIRFLSPLSVGTTVGFVVQAKSGGRLRIFILTEQNIVAAIADIFAENPANGCKNTA